MTTRNRSDEGAAGVMLADLFNSVLAGRAATTTMSHALSHDWLPSMEALLARPGGEAAHGAHVRRLLVRLGWLLNALPQAEYIHASVLDRAIREYRADWTALSPHLFPDAKTRWLQADLLDGELLDCLQVTPEAHRYAPRVARPPIERVAGVAITNAAMPAGLAHGLFSAARR